MRESHPTQTLLILEALEAKAGEWVDMPHLASISGSMNVHTRIDQLRHQHGLHIENRCLRDPGTPRKRSQYRLVDAKLH